MTGQTGAVSVTDAGFDAWPVTTADHLCSGGREPLTVGSTAWADAQGWLWCQEHAEAHAQSLARRPEFCSRCHEPIEYVSDDGGTWAECDCAAGYLV